MSVHSSGGKTGEEGKKTLKADVARHKEVEEVSATALSCKGLVTKTVMGVVNRRGPEYV